MDTFTIVIYYVFSLILFGIFLPMIKILCAKDKSRKISSRTKYMNVWLRGLII